MNKIKICLISVMTLAVVLASACGHGTTNPNTNPNAGFFLGLRVTQGGIIYPLPVLASITGSTTTPANSTGTTGSVNFFQNFFGNGETKAITGAVVPATWNFTVGGVPGSCSGLQQYLRLGNTASIVCNVGGFLTELFVFPSMIDARTPGNSLAMSGQNLRFSATSMPKVFWYDEFGQVVHVGQTVINTNSKGSIESPMPDMTTWANGHYLVLLSSSDDPTQATVIGAAEVTVYGNIDPIEPCRSQTNPCLP
jgi:hypothetical protein